MKRISSFLAIAFALVISLSACGVKETQAQEEQPVETEEIEATTQENSAASLEEESITYTISALKGLEGTWSTSSQGYEYYGTGQPEYYVLFTDSEILYLHKKGEEFVLDHASKIVSVKEIGEEEYVIKAEYSNGNHYSFQTYGSNGLNYFSTWDEDDFLNHLSGSSSLGRNSSEPSAGTTVTISLPVTTRPEGTWKMASQGYEYYSTEQAEYYVKFSDWLIEYYHMEGEELVNDVYDWIYDIEKTPEGRYTIKSKSPNGVEYTYQTSESDNNIMHYYKTWNEDEFQEKYSGSLSLVETD